VIETANARKPSARSLWSGVATATANARKPSARSLWSGVATATANARKPSARSTVLADISSFTSLTRIGVAQNRRPRLALSIHQDTGFSGRLRIL